MMATILVMQPVAHLIVSALVLVLLVTLGRGLRYEVEHEKAALAVDKIWRILIGVGGIPALVTLFLRAGMPESPGYTLNLFGEEPINNDENGTDQLTESEIRWGSYFIAGRFLENIKNWRHLAGISICAFVLNAAIGGLGGNNYRVLAQSWNFSPLQKNNTSLPSWSDGQKESAVIGQAIYDVLFETSLHSLYTLSIASVVGSCVVINYFWWPGPIAKRGFTYFYLSIAVLFTIVASISLPTNSSSPARKAAIAMTIFCFYCSSLG
jgi:MFS transporter, PHS family, inorganic phosphate transporter